jgi:hypothetical protein
VNKLLLLPFLFFFIIPSSAFQVSQLPISEKLIRSFPKLKAKRFVIVNKDCNIVVHEKNSFKKIDKNITSSKIYKYENKQLTIRNPQSEKVEDFEFAKNMELILKKNKTALYDICCIFADLLEEPQRGYGTFFQNINGADICFFESSSSTMGCMFNYKNTNSCEFTVVLYEFSSKEQAVRDIKSVIQWLDQFFVSRISSDEKAVTKIPVLYGVKESVLFKNLSNRSILLSKKHSNQVTKVIRYRTVIRAPFEIGTELGFVFYFTDLFKNPIVETIVSIERIEKANWTKCILDSICYIVFGTSAYHVKNRDLG